MPTAKGRLRKGDRLERRDSPAVFEVMARLGLTDYSIRVRRVDGEPFPWQQRMVRSALVHHADGIVSGDDGEWRLASEELQPRGAGVTHMEDWLAERGRRDLPPER